MKSVTLIRLTMGAAALTIAHPTLGQVGKPKYGTFGIDLTSEDKSGRPGDDFWSYANGAWAKRTEIPADKGAVGYGNQLAVNAEADVHALLDDIAANPAAYGTTGKQIGDFYASWMNEAGIEAKGTAPLQP